MSFNESLTARLKVAMLAKDTLAINTVRMLITAVKNEEIQLKKTLDENEFVTVVKRLINQRKDAAKIYKDANDLERYNQELSEISVLKEFSPAMLEGDALAEVVKSLVTSLNITEKKQTGFLMKALKDSYGTAFDGKEVSQILSGLL